MAILTTAVHGNRFLQGAACALVLLLSACSLKYQDESSVQQVQEPQFTFRNAVFTRYEDNTCTLRLSSTRIEQYQDTDTSFIKYAEFTLWDDSQEMQAEGRCKLLVADTLKNSYSMFNDIDLHGGQEHTLLQGTSLKWNKVGGQLVTGDDSDVHIERDGISVTGSGFSADSNTGEFVFTKPVSGTIETSGEEAE